MNPKRWFQSSQIVFLDRRCSNASSNVHTVFYGCACSYFITYALKYAMKSESLIANLKPKPWLQVHKCYTLAKCVKIPVPKYPHDSLCLCTFICLSLYAIASILSFAFYCEQESTISVQRSQFFLQFCNDCLISVLGTIITLAYVIHFSDVLVVFIYFEN